MTTTTAPVAITCPDWCEDSPQHHADELSNQGGVCIHATRAALVENRTGVKSDALAEPQVCTPVKVQLYAVTRPEGTECASPWLFVDGQQMSIEQAEALAEALRSQLEQYRTWQKEQQ